jgi:UDP-glucose 4-epimerase
MLTPELRFIAPASVILAPARKTTKQLMRCHSGCQNRMAAASLTLPFILDSKLNQCVWEGADYFVKILVTGGAGYIGGTVAGLLAQNGHQTVVFDNLSHGRRDLLPPGIDFIEGELADRPGLEKIFTTAKAQGSPFDGVLHFAALIEAGESMLHPELYFRNNTASTLALLEAILAHGPRRLVFSSTAAVYGEPEVLPIKEDARLLPTNVYGESKLMVEQMLDWFHRIHGLRSASLRYFNVAGAPDGPNGVTRGEAHEPESHLIPLVLDVALGRRPSIGIYGEDYLTPDGTCIRDYIHVSDLADAHLLALKLLETVSATESRLIFNLGNGQGFSVLEVIESARRVTGHPIPAEVHPRRPGDPAVLVASSEKAIRELGWKPRYTQLDEIIRTAWVWHQKRYAP